MGLRSLEGTSLLRSSGKRVCRQLLVESILLKKYWWSLILRSF